MADSEGTDVYYGEGSRLVHLKNVLTRNWEFKAEYDEDGTLIGYRWKAEFETLAVEMDSEEELNLGIQQPATLGDPNVRYNKVKRYLMTPRQRLQVYLKGELLIDIRQQVEQVGSEPPFVQNQREPNGFMGHELDIEHGPRPTRFDISHVTGNSVLRVVWAVESFLQACDTKMPPIVASRWAVSEHMNEDFFITRRFNGYLRKSNWQSPSANYREWMFPGLETGFRRTSVEYDEHDDGLGIDWRIIDKQVHVAAPWPMTRLEGTQTESTGNGIQWHTELRLRGYGSPEATKRDMMQQMARIVERRIKYKPNEAANSFQLEGVTIVDHFGEKNMIEFAVRLKHLFGNEEGTDQDATEAFYTGMRADMFDEQLWDLSATPDPANAPHAYQVNLHRIPSPWGYDPFGGERLPNDSAKWEHLLRDLCEHDADAPLGTERSSEMPPGGYTAQRGGGGSGPRITQSPGVGEEYDNSNFSDESLVAMYTIAKASDEYIHQNRRIALPVMWAGAGARGHYSHMSAIVNYGGAAIYRYVTMEFERVGKWPTLPPPDDSYLDPHSRAFFRLLSHRVQLRQPTPAADGQNLIYHLWAQYVYVQQGGRGMGFDHQYAGLSLAMLPGMNYRKHFDTRKIYKASSGSRGDNAHIISPRMKDQQSAPQGD
jgi:hypothetical protein